MVDVQMDRLHLGAIALEIGSVLFVKLGPTGELPPRLFALMERLGKVDANPLSHS